MLVLTISTLFVILSLSTGDDRYSYHDDTRSNGDFMNPYPPQDQWYRLPDSSRYFDHTYTFYPLENNNYEWGRNPETTNNYYPRGDNYQLPSNRDNYPSIFPNYENYQPRFPNYDNYQTQFPYDNNNYQTNNPYFSNKLTISPSDNYYYTNDNQGYDNYPPSNHDLHYYNYPPRRDNLNPNLHPRRDNSRIIQESRTDEHHNAPHATQHQQYYPNNPCKNLANNGSSYSIKGVCFGYFLCADSEAVYRECPKHSSYDFYAQQCVHNTSCVSACPVGMTPDSSPFHYRQIVHGKLKIRPCPAKTFFDHRACTCNHIQARPSHYYGPYDPSNDD